MATRTHTITTDDLTGEEGATTHTIAFDGRSYEVDLTDESWNNLLDVELHGLIAAARPIKNNSRPSANRYAPPRNTSRIRAWAWTHGYPNLGSRGRIPTHIVDAYNADPDNAQDN